MTLRIHVAIVSDQTLPTLIPVLMERPDMVILVCTPAMRQKKLDRRIQKILDKNGIPCEVQHGAPDAGLEAIEEFATQALIDLQERWPQAELTFNATGGTKLMTLGFLEVLRPDCKYVTYTDTSHGQIEYIHPRAPARLAPKPMVNILKVGDYLAAQGFSAIPASDDDDAQGRITRRKPAAKFLGRHAAALQDLIGTLNGRMAKALTQRDEEVANPHIDLNHVSSKLWREALSEFHKAGLIDWEGGSSFTLMSAEAGRFLKGGWLEEYAWHVVRDERPYDCRINVRGNWATGQQAFNEFDVLASHRNQLLFIECKTLSYTQGGEDSELIYKIDSLSSDARGLYGQSWLLSAREPSQTITDRALLANLRVLGPEELPKLRDHVRKWMGL